MLIVDDEESILASLRRLLRREPYELVVASDAAEAMRAMEERPAQVVISDQRMPGVTGIELVREIRKRWPDTLRIILSGYSEVGTIIAAVNEGEIYKFLSKPWNDEELKLHVRRAFEQFELQADNRRMAKEIGSQNGRLRELNSLLDQRAVDASAGQTFAQQLLEAVDVGVLAIDEDGLVVAANARVREIVCSGDCDLVGSSARSTMPPVLYEAIFGGTAAPHAVKAGRTDVDGLVLQWRARPFIETDDSREIVVTIWRDVT